MEYKIFLLIISLNCCIRWCYGQDTIRMTILSNKHFASEDDDGVIQCRMTPEVNNQNEYNVESLRIGDTRSDSETIDYNPPPPSPVYNGGNHPHYRISMQNNGNNDAFGVFGCNATKDGMETVVSTTRMRSNADIVPRNGLFTQTVSVGDTDVSINMKISDQSNVLAAELRWRNDTKFWGPSHPSYGKDTFTFEESIQMYHAGIYECHQQGNRNSAVHGLNLLIVRACPHTRWGPPDCEGVCDSCHNGGVCDENTGQCVCPPGFSGTNCLTACGGNRYGYECEQRCTYSNSDPKDRCGGPLFCLLHPFGCRCNTGFKGLDCNTACDVNTFGASCLQSCHCASDQCDPYTGECEGTDTSCDPGWTGTYCQECPDGYFGSSCDQECHCSSDKCNRETGLCQPGGCLPHWADLFPPYSCQSALENATFTKVNAGVQVPVNCTALQGPGWDWSKVAFVLSRSEDDLDNNDVNIAETFTLGGKITRLFMVGGINQDKSLYCQLRDQNGQRAAFFEVEVEVYVLPVLKTAPTAVSTSNTSVTIAWTAWEGGNDVGDPPLVGYVTYYREQKDNDWIKGGDVSTSKPTQYTFFDLDSDTDYSFSVAAVREGEGGEGPASPSLEVKTICAVPLDAPRNVTTDVAGDEQQFVEISWEYPVNEHIRCRSGVLMFTIFYSLSLTPSEEVLVEVNSSTATSYIIEGLEVGQKYVFEMTLITEGGESKRSSPVEHLLPVLPQLSDSLEYADSTSTSLTVRWAAWDGAIGTPPVVSYNLYHKSSDALEWSDPIPYDALNGKDQYYGVVEDLLPDSLYDFSVSALREGYGGEGPMGHSLEKQKTLCDDPLNGPQEVVTTIAGEKQELVNVSWKLPSDSQIRCSTGVLGFQIYYSSTSSIQNDERVVEVADSSATFYIIDDLERGKEYVFEITLLTEGGESDKSNPTPHFVPVLPSLKTGPISDDISCNAVTVTWNAWTEGEDEGTPPITQYFAYYRLSSEPNMWKLSGSVNHSTDQSDLKHTFEDLTEETPYVFAIAVVREGYGGEGDKNTNEERTSKCGNPGAIAGGTIGVSLFIILVIVLIIFWIRRDSNAKGKEADYAGTVNNACTAEPGNSYTSSKSPPEDEDDAVYANVEVPVPIVLKDFEKYIKTTELEQLFLKFSSEPQFATDVGAKEANKTKNRFKNMIAYDHSRVVLPKKSNDPHSDYYNANYIKNSESKVGFIAAQGPNKASVDDFWRMVCMENVSTIVMLTNLIENGKDRCCRYWPTSVGETRVFGKINVKWQSSEQYPNFEKREYLVTEEDKKAHRVLNWHYTTWPDKDIPDQPSTLIEFAKRVKGDREHTTTPLLVHCSAGVGRTGTFIALCSLMDVVETSEKIDVYGFVAKMREDRVNMVQTAKQFKFLHECLLEVYLTGDTSIPIEKLTTFEVNTEGVKLGKQFNLLAKLDKMSQQRSSRAANESEKCRFPDIIPVEKKRPYLQSQGKNSSSNYINACSVMSYRKEAAYIATQSPLPSTIEDFWRLVYDWKCPLIVMLNQLEKKDETVCKYWPDADSSQYGHITVELKEERKENYYMYRIFQVDHAHTQKPISVHHLQLNSWDENNLWDIHSFINAIEKLEKDFTMVEPTVIHCINGVGRTGVVIAVKSEMERIEAEKKVDVFTTVRQMRASNHNLVQTKEEYALCHHLLKLSSPESTYANI